MFDYQCYLADVAQSDDVHQLAESYMINPMQLLVGGGGDPQLSTHIGGHIYSLSTKLPPIAGVPSMNFPSFRKKI